MGLSLVQSRVLLGLEAVQVTVEVHLANGLPCFTLVGLADLEVREARERVRCAIQNSGLAFPSNKRITVNLAPADLPKDSGRLDLPIALGLLAAAGQIDGAALAGHEFAGELSLSGALRPVRGALAMALATQIDAPAPVTLVLPQASAREAALVPGARVYGAAHLLEVVRQFATPALNESGVLGDCAGAAWAQVPAGALPACTDGPDLSDVKGQVGPKRALEIAAAGGHSLLLVGPPGSGKSMLAQRLGGLLPEMTVPEALQCAAIASLRGGFDLARWGQRPTAQPHHSASAVALVGGGMPPQPGEISLAHHGVLFLDEMPEFSRRALEALREPLEVGCITISRAARRCEFPARFQLVGAMNPCPCGYFGSAQRSCRCSPDQVARYQGRLSGPLLDRIDLHVEVPLLPAQALLQESGAETSAVVRARCVQAHTRAMQRQGRANHAVASAELLRVCALDAAAETFLQTAALRWSWSSRGIHRSLRVARTIADLAGSEAVQVAHLAQALQFRNRTAMDA